jgi:homeobox protein cut-like
MLNSKRFACHFYPETHTLTFFSLQELRKQFQIISELRTEIKTLQADNLKLYEKVRYMQSYREDSGSRPVTQLDPLPAPSARLDDMSKYQARYEEAMNPFEAFRGRVSSKLICEVKLTN